MSKSGVYGGQLCNMWKYSIGNAPCCMGKYIPKKNPGTQIMYITCNMAALRLCR